MNWADAQHYCREKYTDLATITSMEDISRLNRPTLRDSWAWIGLRDDPKSWRESMGNDINSWRWSVTGETSKTGYHNWDAPEPNNTISNDICVVTTPKGKWADQRCETSYHFICYNVTNENEKTYVYISTLKTWTDARDYCRKYYTDLPMIENNEENDEVSAAIEATDPAWIGLYRVRWSWSDKSQSSVRFWRSGSPNNVGGNQFCVSENPLHEWDDDGCNFEYPFICQQVTKLKTTLRMKIETDADFTDPATNAQILQQLGAELTRFGISSFACHVCRQFHYVNLQLNWVDAQHYCREKYGDLATIQSMEDISRLNRPTLIDPWVWIGLRDDPKSWRESMGNDANSWRWSATDPNVTTTMRMKIETDADMTDPATNTQILQQLTAKLTSQGWTDFKLQWKIQPRKQEKEKLTE
ncbi:C-type mannose receptor 2-like [Sebastes umbrosus]|uniref:C-type mannose receptor 2-like n=1 Tax=Sebastes umbrosus TaxID=72105 RepID=UPI00189CC87D|nr:C-type mannose receptor 2-like [Sebastes umbrosus]